MEDQVTTQGSARELVAPGFPLEELLASAGGDSHGVNIDRLELTEGVYLLPKANGYRQREHYYEGKTYRCLAQTDEGMPSDDECPLCTAARFKKKMEAKTRIYVLGVDLMSGAFGHLSWNEGRAAKPGKGGAVYAHQAMLKVLGTGRPSKPFCLHKQEGGWQVILEFPTLPEDITTPTEEDVAQAVKAWERFDPSTAVISIPNEALVEEFPDLAKYRDIR